MSFSGKRRQVQINRRARLGNMPDGFNSTGFSSFQPIRGFPMAYSPPQFELTPSISMGSLNFAQSPIGSSMSSDDCRAGKFIFKNRSERVNPDQYPSVFFNGQLQDVNDVVKNIVLRREPAPIVQEGTRSLLCPLSRVPITCPARGVNCNHVDCFDLRQFLMLRLSEGSPCPICNQPLFADDLRFDPSFFAVRARPPVVDDTGTFVL